MPARINHLLRHFALLVLFAGMSGRAVVCAQDSAVEREAKAEFEAGIRAASAQDYAVAREHFMRSRQLVVKASTLLNLAITDLKLGLFDEAMFALDAIEAPEPGPEQNRLRQRARRLREEIAALREDVTKARTDSTQPGEAAQQEQEVPVQPDVADEPVPAGTTSLAVAASVDEVVPAQTTPREREQPSPAPSLRGARTLLALGGVLGLGALGGTLWWYNRHVAEEACLTERDDERCSEERAIERERVAATAVTSVLGAASVGMIIGGAIWLVSRKETPAQRVSVAFTPGRRALRLVARVTF